MDEMQGSISSDWTASLRQGAQPQAAALIDHLQAVHAQNPGFTEGCARRCIDAQGRTSYDWLGEVARDAGAHRILDLACGSGFLIETCLDLCSSAARITGVDMSEAELLLARARLPMDRVELFAGRADDLSMLADGGVDAVLCHWALTLMEPIEDVLVEIGRVLAPGGVFAAIVDGPAALAPGYEAIDAMIFEEVASAAPGYEERDLGDPRVRDADRLEALCREAFGSEARIETQCAAFTLEGEAQDVAREALGFYYAAYVLSQTERDRLIARIADYLEQQDRPVAYHMPICRLTIKV